VSKTWYQTPSSPTNTDQSMSKTWYQTLSSPTNWPVYVKNLISDSFPPNQLSGFWHRLRSDGWERKESDFRFMTPTGQLVWKEGVWYQIFDIDWSIGWGGRSLICLLTHTGQLIGKEVVTPSFLTNWPVCVKNLISDYFLSQPSDLSLCQKPDIRLLPSQPTDLSLSQKPDIRESDIRFLTQTQASWLGRKESDIRFLTQTQISWLGRKESDIRFLTQTRRLVWKLRVRFFRQTAWFCCIHWTN
jgi:hypothetical protein